MVAAPMLRSGVTAKDKCDAATNVGGHWRGVCETPRVAKNFDKELFRGGPWVFFDSLGHERPGVHNPNLLPPLGAPKDALSLQAARTRRVY